MSKLTTTTYTLIHPITKGERTLTELTFRRPKIKDLITWNEEETKSEFAETSLLVSILTGEPQVILDEMDLEDYTEVLGICKDFLKILEPKPTPKQE